MALAPPFNSDVGSAVPITWRNNKAHPFRGRTPYTHWQGAITAQHFHLDQAIENGLA